MTKHTSVHPWMLQKVFICLITACENVVQLINITKMENNSLLPRYSSRILVTFCKCTVNLDIASKYQKSLWGNLSVINTSKWSRGELLVFRFYVEELMPWQFYITVRPNWFLNLFLYTTQIKCNCHQIFIITALVATMVMPFRTGSPQLLLMLGYAPVCTYKVYLCALHICISL